MKLNYQSDEKPFLYETCTVPYLSAQSMPPEKYYHWHNSIEILCVDSGSLRLSVGKRTYDLYTGDYAVIKSCDQHGYCCGYADLSAEISSYRISPSLVRPYDKLKNTSSLFVRAADLQREAFTDFVRCAKAGLQRESRNPDSYSEALIGAYAVELYLTLLKVGTPLEDTGTVISSEYEKLFPDFNGTYESSAIGIRTMNRFQEILDYVDSHFTDASLCLTKLSSLSGLSACYISELFPAVIGIRFKQYLQALRINHALHLFAMKKATVAQIAYESGFDTIRTFNTVFKKLRGVTPTAYLNSSAEQESGVSTGFEGLRIQNGTVSAIVYGENGSVECADDPFCAGRQVFLVTTERRNKVWVSFNVRMRFRAGATYKVACDICFLPDANGNDYLKSTAGINFFYGSAEKEAGPHSLPGVKGGVGDGWLHIESVYTVDADYVPGLYDKFSVFGHPINDVGIRFLLDNVTCREID